MTGTYDSSPARDPDDRRSGVACPICGDESTERRQLEAHLASEHGLDERAIYGRPARAGESRSAKLKRGFLSLGFLPLWFVLPLNALLFWLAWVSVRDPLFDFTGGLVVRFSLLPAILLLTARVASVGPRL